MAARYAGFLGVAMLSHLTEADEGAEFRRAVRVCADHFR